MLLSYPRRHFSDTSVLTNWTQLSEIMSTHPNGGLDLAVNYPNIWCFVQQTYKIGVMCNTSTKSRWFVQFPRVKSILL